EFRLRLRAGNELNELPGELTIRRALKHTPGAGAAHRAVPDDFDRNALLLQFAAARVPHRHHFDFAVAQQLLRLVTLAPPDFDVRLDLIELFERAVEIKRVELVHRHAVGEEGVDAGARRVAQAQRAGSRKLLHVPEVRPGFR